MTQADCTLAALQFAAQLSKDNCASPDESVYGRLGVKFRYVSKKKKWDWSRDGVSWTQCEQNPTRLRISKDARDIIRALSIVCPVPGDDYRLGWEEFQRKVDVTRLSAEDQQTVRGFSLGALKFLQNVIAQFDGGTPKREFENETQYEVAEGVWHNATPLWFRYSEALGWRWSPDKVSRTTVIT